MNEPGKPAAAAGLDDVALRDFRPEDLDAILALRARVFPGLDVERERRRWRWEFDQNPFRAPNVPSGWVLEQAGRIVGNYGLVPLPVSIDRKPHLALNGIDFAVEPELQGRGLGHLIARRHMDPAACAFPFLMAPTPPVAHLMQKHGGARLRAADEPMVWRFGCASATATPRPPREVAIEKVDGFGPRFDELFNRVKERHRLLLARDHRYLNWRYRDYPFGRPTMVSAIGRDGLLRGYFVLQHDLPKNCGYLLEFFADPREEWVLRGLAAGAIAAARQAKLAELLVLNRVPEVQRVLQANGFEPVAGAPLEFTARLPPGIDAKEWYLSSGDGDLLWGIGALAPP